MQGQRFLAIVAVGIASGTLAFVSLEAHDPITTRVTWAREISRIVQARCVSCHSPGGRAPMSLATYEDARPWARAIREEVLTRRMPKWHAERGYGDFSNDPSLSQHEIALIAAWADGGAPRGTDEARPQGTPKEGDTRTEAGRDEREIDLPCGETRLPAGSLMAIRPLLPARTALGVSVRFPDGGREIVGLIRDFDPAFATTYRLRFPIDLPDGGLLSADWIPASPSAAPSAPARCSVVATLRPRR